MLRHIVLWKVKDNEDKEKNMDLIVRMLYSLDGKIKGLESVELGYSIDQSSEYDVSLCASFKSASALKYYQTHPDHVRYKEFIAKVTEKRVSFDFVPEDPEFMEFDFPKEVLPQQTMPANSSPDHNVQSADQQSLVRPIIPGINAPGDFIIPEESDEYQGSYIHSIVQKSAKEAQEDYDILESIVDPNDQYNTNTIAEEAPAADIGSAVPFAKTSSQTPPSTATVRPTPPANPTTPVQPAAPTQPFTPAQPAAPTQPFTPAQPAAPTQPFTPVKPAAPTQPFTPAQPVTPTQPFAPAQPAAPTQVPANEYSQTEGARSNTPKPSINIPKPQQRSRNAVSKSVGNDQVNKPTPATPVASAAPVAPAAPAAPVMPAVPKPQKKSRFFGAKKAEAEAPKTVDMTNKWRCPSCGRINADYVGTCGCGQTKPFDDFGSTEDNQADQEEIEQNGWKCPNCGLLHSNFINDCSCGYVNTDIDTGNASDKDALRSASPMTASDFSHTPDRVINAGVPKPPATETPSVDVETAKSLKFHDNGRSTPSSASKSPVGRTAAANPAPQPFTPAAKAEKKPLFGRKKKEEVKEEIDMSKYWTCPNCGKLNNNYVGTCGCGESKPFDFGNDNIGGDTRPTPKSNAWKCPACGRLNNNFITTCQCGYDVTNENAQ